MYRKTTLATPLHRSRREAGFSLMEITVSMLILAIMITAILQLFDSSAQVANAQLEQADLQQSIRVGQSDMVSDIRLGGRGGLLPTGPIASSATQWPQIACLGPCGNDVNVGMPLRFDSNVVNGTTILKGGGINVPEVAIGTDVLTIRGIITRPVWLVEGGPDTNTFTYDSGSQVGKIVLNNHTPWNKDIKQDLNEIEVLITENIPEALFMTSAFSDTVFGIAKLDHTNTSFTKSGNDITEATIAFKFEGDTTGEAYAKGSTDGVFPINKLVKAGIGKVGILEEYRYYIRHEEINGEERRYLTRARLLPGIEQPYPDGGVSTTNQNLLNDVADNVLDMQIALGFDCDKDGDVRETTDGIADEWLGNNEDDFNSMTSDPMSSCLTDRRGSALSLLRITTVARSRDPQRNRQAPMLIRIEDKDYTDILYAKTNDMLERLYLRVTMTTLVDMRNL